MLRLWYIVGIIFHFLLSLPRAVFNTKVFFSAFSHIQAGYWDIPAIIQKPVNWFPVHFSWLVFALFSHPRYGKLLTGKLHTRPSFTKWFCQVDVLLIIVLPINRWWGIQQMLQRHQKMEHLNNLVLKKLFTSLRWTNFHLGILIICTCNKLSENVLVPDMILWLSSHVFFLFIWYSFIYT